jgi:histidyl-tRNA synthetase
MDFLSFKGGSNMIQKPKGTYDTYGVESRKIRYLNELFTLLMDKYNYSQVRTPIFENSELFHRGVGESSDIVTKETYDFTDRGNRNMTLRPEGTAGVVRSYIENKMYGDATKPTKLWYNGFMYRYERPQSGRFREFNQFGVEVIGSSSAMLDAEVISIPVNFYKLLGLKGIKVNINTLGDLESRNNYRQALKDYFKPYLNQLCTDCNNRFEKNPLRILDCKIDHDKDIMKNAPKMIDYLNEESKIHYEKVKKYLEELGIEYVENPNLVRGLDYYTHTVFEVEAEVEGFGSQNVLCGGGRYDLLVEMLDGPSTPAVGFALGIERLLTALDYENIDIIEEKSLDAYIIPMSDNESEYAFKLLNHLRMNGFNSDIDYMGRKIGSNFKQADRFNSKYVIIIGEEEIKTNIITIKDNNTKEEYKIDANSIISFLDERIIDDHEKI